MSDASNLPEADKRGLRLLERRRRLWPTDEHLAARLIKAGANADRHEIQLSDPPPEPAARYLVAGKPVCTAGNLTAIVSQSKTGKSAFVGAMIASRIAATIGTSPNCDFLGVSSGIEDPGSLVLHIDTEQSRFDHFTMVRRILERAKTDQQPSWYRAYSMAGVSARELREYLRGCVFRGMLSGIHSVIIDGVADLVADVNEADECNKLVAELHDLAIKADCAIIGVIHENPGSSIDKGRGHLGSQLQRKCESNLRLTKTDEITTVFSERMRRAPILEKDGPRFRWSNADSMHVSVAAAGDARLDAKRREAAEQAEEVFAGKHQMKYGEIVAALMDVRAISRATAERRVKEWGPLEVITGPVFGQYTLNPQTTLKTPS